MFTIYADAYQQGVLVGILSCTLLGPIIVMQLKTETLWCCWDSFCLLQITQNKDPVVWALGCVCHPYLEVYLLWNLKTSYYVAKHTHLLAPWLICTWYYHELMTSTLCVGPLNILKLIWSVVCQIFFYKLSLDEYFMNISILLFYVGW